jgi:fructose-bisphosphate aldolase, class II
MLVNSPKIFYRHAFENKYAFPAFNVWNLEIAKAVAKAADLENAAVIMQTFYGDLDYGGIEQLASISQHVINQAKSPILLHLDHPTGLPMVLQCLKNGYRSVMFDGGSLPLDENVRETAKAAEVAHALDAVIEGEIGQFGGEHQAGTVQECTPDDAERMFKESGIDMLAISVGSVHGEPSRLKLPLLKEIANRTRGQLVLHGGSGINPDDLTKSLEMGVVKVNIGAAVFQAWISGLEEGVAQKSSDPHEPRHYAISKHAMDKVTEAARGRIKLMRASDRADSMKKALQAEA